MAGELAGSTVSVTKAMLTALNFYMESASIGREELCMQTGWRHVGKSEEHCLTLEKANRILPGSGHKRSQTLSTPIAIRIARTIGMDPYEFVTGKVHATNSIAHDNGWDVDGEDLSWGEFPNGVSYVVRRMTHAESGTIGRGKFYRVSEFSMEEREQMRWRLTRHDFVSGLVAGFDGSKPKTVIRRFSEKSDIPLLSQRITSFWTADEYLVIDEWIEGRSLGRYLFMNANPPASFVRNVMKSLAAGLALLHENGVILRWLDPGRILVNDTGSGSIVDFEFAKLSGHLGTVRPDHQINSSYLSPQVREGMEKIDSSTDLYSWACILAKVVTGQEPGSKEADPKQLIGDSKLPKTVKTAALKCLERAPRNRFRNGSELFDALGRW